MSSYIRNSKLLFFVLVLFLILNTSVSLAKWVSIGFDETWNDGLFKGNKLDILGFCLDGKNNPHLLCSVNSKCNYLYFDGKSWKGFEGNEPTEITMFTNPLSESNPVMRIDSKNFPHLIYFEHDALWKINNLNYIFWDGSKWSEKNEIIRTNSDTDPLIITGTSFNFILDKNDQPHVIYLINTAPKMQNYSYICYRYLDNGEWKTLDDGDKESGVFKEITNIYGKYTDRDKTWARHYIKLDSKGYPHIGCMLYYGPELSDPSSCIYTYYDGEKWTGIEGSQKEMGLPDSYIDVEGDIDKYNFNVHIDKDDNVHFIYTAKIDGISHVVYRKWDGSKWSGLKSDEDYSNVDLDFYRSDYFSNLSSTGTPNIFRTGATFNSYNYWDVSSWAGLGGTDKLNGITPTGFIKTVIKGFEAEECPKSFIAGTFSYRDSQGNYTYHISVLKWEDETVPTVELYTNDLDHPTSDPTVRICGRLNNPYSHDADINLIVAMMNPQGDILFFPNWTKDYNFMPLILPAGYALPWTELLYFAIPSDSPPVKTAGTYYFGILLNKPGTNDYYSYDIKPFYITE
jgi:hypothetical protein